MNGVHDMGGFQNMGPIQVEDNESVFQSEWERRVFAINLATGPLRLWNQDMKRQATESMQPPGRYLNAPYYERWLEGLIELLKDRKLISEAELASEIVSLEALPETPPAASADQVLGLIRAGRSARIDADVAPRFNVADEVVTRNINPRSHTRLPRYARGRRGRVERDHGVFIFPDTHAQNWEQKPQHVYAVSFTARELWGEAASATDKIILDLWDDYMDHAP